MTSQTVENFETHFDRFLQNRQSSTLGRIQNGSTSFDQELNDMQIAAMTLISDYGIIYAENDPIDQVALTRSAVAIMHKYFRELSERIERN
jgi:hypothetical protein